MLLRDQITNDPCDQLLNVRPSGITPNLYSKVAQALSYVMAYSHDGEYALRFSELRHAYDLIASNYPALSKALTEHFSEYLYIHRTEEDELLNEIADRELVLLRSRVGEGKSCIMRRIVWDRLRNPDLLKDQKYKKALLLETGEAATIVPIYINLMHLIEPLDAIGESNTQELGKMLYLYQDFPDGYDESARVSFERIFKARVLQEVFTVLHITNAFTELDNKEWLAAQVLHSDTEMIIRNAIEAEFDVNADTIASMTPYLSTPYIKKRLREIPIKTTMEALFAYCLHRKWLLVLMLDNIDRYPLHCQQQVLTLSLDWAAKRAVKVVIAVRERNIRRIDDVVQAAQWIGNVYLNPLISFALDSAPIDGYAQEKETLSTTILDMVKHRISIFTQYASDLIPKSLERIASGDSKLSTKPFMEHFLSQYETILQGLLGTGYYYLSNHCVRTLLPMLGQQALRVMFGPEQDYYNCIKDRLNPDTYDFIEGQRSTKRHSFYYKLLLSQNECIPSFAESIPNIFSTPQNGIVSIDLTVLEFLMQSGAGQSESLNYIQQNADRSVRFILSNLVRCGFEANDLLCALDRLSEKYGYGPTGFIERLSRLQSGRINLNDEYIEREYAILPAGIYFINKLITTCEYAFWAILSTEIPEDIGSRILSGLHNYTSVRPDDEFKLSTVTKFLELYTLPKLKAYKRIFESRDNESWSWTQFINRTCWQSTPYPLRLINSLLKWIRYTNMTTEKKKMYHTILTKLQSEMNHECILEKSQI